MSTAALPALMNALDRADEPNAPTTLEAGLSLAARVMQRAEEEGRSMTRDEALFRAGQQLAQGIPSAPAKTQRVWTHEELEALYPPGVSTTLRGAAPFGFMSLVTAMMLGLVQVMDWLDATSVSTGAGWARAGWLALTGLGFWASKRLANSVAEPNAVFRKRIKAVDTDSLVRWYHSGTCVDHMVVFGVLHDRGVRVH